MGSAVKVISSTRNPNLLINGGFLFSQRFANANIPINVSTKYTLDRWNCFFNSSGSDAGTVVKTFPVAEALPISTGCGMRVQRNAGSTNTGGLIVTHPIENKISRPLMGKKAYLTFKAKCGANYSPTGSLLTVTLICGNGGAEPAPAGSLTNQQTAISASVVLSTSYQEFTIEAPAAFSNDYLQWRLVYRANNTGTAGANDWFELADVGLYAEGPDDFKLAGGDYAGELLLCQRYYEKSYDLDSPPGTVTGSGATQIVIAQQDTANEYRLSTKFSVRKRTSAPAMTIYNPSTGAANQIDSGATAVVVAVGENGFTSGKGPASGSSNSVYYHWVADAEL